MAFPTPPALLARTLAADELEKNPSDALLRIYAWMQLARSADNRILDLFRQGLIRGTVTGGQGNEGLAVTLALLAEKAHDVISFTHRDFGGHIVWSGHLCDHLNQYFANALSPTKAREGNIHHGDPTARSLPMISHLGSMLSNVAGATDSQRRFGRPAVGFALFGDGGSSTGDIHETLNLASLLSLPILFIIENNRYAYSTPLAEQFHGDAELWHRAAGYGIEGFSLDATADMATTARTLSAAIAKVRATSRPILIEAHTLRLRGHAAYDTCDYLKPGESDEFFSRDSLPKLRAQLVASLGAARLDAVDAELGAFLEACVQDSLSTPRPDPAGMEADLYAPDAAPLSWTAEPAKPENLTFAQALNRALKKILTERSESVVLGQDIGVYGGAFKVTEGLLAEFGRPRVFNTPLAESGCTGWAVGMALNGHRPIEEFQFADFVTEAATQITLNAATYYFRSGAKVPLVLRLPTGGGLTFGSFHSQELDSFFAGDARPQGSLPQHAAGRLQRLLAAYEDNNPVILFEHKALYRRGRAPVAFDPHYRAVWTPRQLRTGDFATFVTYGEMVGLAEEAVDYFAAEYEKTFDLFDLRALSPLKLDAIEASLAHTGRLIVLHEGRRTHGFGAELIARLTESHFSALKSAPLRIASLDLPVPFAPELEQAFRPTKDKTIDRIAAWIG